MPKGNGTADVVALRRQPLRGVRLTEQIVTSAHELLHATGQGFTIQELVDEAGIALQTFYRHFRSKDDLLMAVLTVMIRESCAQLEERTRSLPNPVDRLRVFVTDPIRLLADDGGVVRGRVTTSEHFRLFQLFPAEVEKATQPFAALVQAAIEHGAARALVRSADPAADARVITWLVMTTFHHYSFADRCDLDRAIAQLWSFCARVIGVDGGSVAAQSRRTGPCQPDPLVASSTASNQSDQ